MFGKVGNFCGFVREVSKNAVAGNFSDWDGPRAATAGRSRVPRSEAIRTIRHAAESLMNSSSRAPRKQRGVVAVARMLVMAASGLLAALSCSTPPYEFVPEP